MKLFKIIITVAGALTVFGCGNVPTTNNSGVATATPAAAKPVETPFDELAAGRAAFNQNCAACHKEDGTGGKMTIEGKTLDVEDLTAEKIKKFTDDKITGYIYNGIEDDGMPAFKDKLSEAQIREIVDYVRGGIQKMPLTSR